MVAEAAVWAALGEVQDPELPVGIVDLGLVRSVRIQGGAVHVGITFTSIACPCTDVLAEDVQARLGRLQELVTERSPATPAALGEILADHGGGGPQTICEHGVEDPADEASAIVFSMICDLDLGRMWVAPGSPCVTAYEEVDLAGVV